MNMVMTVRGSSDDAWAPLRRPVYRGLLLAQFGSNVGTWMQTVGAQWLMGDMTHGPVAVALVQTAVTLPVFLIVLPAGALGDLVDRRRLLIIAQGTMSLIGAGLAALTAVGATTPAILLAMTFALGAGQAFVIPSWHAIQPDLVARDEIPQAATLHGVNMNLARAVGPAIGGLLIATVGPAAVFAINAASFSFSVVALARWRRPPQPRPLAREGLVAAVRAGAAYVRSAPPLRVLLLRTATFIAFASALWALIPVVVRDRLGLGATGYGLLLGAIGLGAASGAIALPALRARLSMNAVIALGCALYGGGLLVLASSTAPAAAIVVLPGVGLAWVAVLSSLNAAAQSMLPAWTRARGLAWFVVVIMAGQAIGSLLWGLVAQYVTLSAALAIAGTGLVASSVAGRRLPVRWLDVDLTASQHWPAADLAEDLPPDAGPFRISVTYRVRAGAAPAFREAMGPVGRARRRIGAARWTLEQDPDDERTFVESWSVASWAAHVRQHRERATVRDHEWEAHALALVEEGSPPEVKREAAPARRRRGWLQSASS
jgi:MFS family permease